MADANKSTLRVDDVELDVIAHTVKRAGRVIRLAPKEAQLLEALMRHPGHLLTRTMIFERVWGYSFDPGTNVIDVHILSLRRKLEISGLASPISTVRGLGYKYLVS